MLLFVTDASKSRARLRPRLAEHGVYTLVCPFETAEFYCDEKDTSGVLLDCIANLPRAEVLCAALRRRYPDMPICAIIAPLAVPNLEVHRLIRENGDIFEDVLDFCIRDCGWKVERLTTDTLTLEDDPAKTVYMGYPLSLTPREHTLLRCLFYRSPRVTSTDDLLSLCFSDADVGLCAANLPTHIANINRRAREIDPRPLIVNVYGKGYRLRDGVVI